MRAADPAPEPIVLRLGDLSSAVVAVVHMLGFQPAESIVAVALCGPRERMTFAMRVDLPVADDQRAVASEIATRMAHANAAAVMLFVFTADRPAGGVLPQRDLVDAVVDALDMPVADAVLVGSGRLWSYVCDDEVCCPPEGRLFDTGSQDALAVAAAHTLRGHSVLPDRETAVAAVQPVGGIAAVSMLQATERAAEAWVTIGLAEFPEQVRRELDELADRFTDPRAVVDDDEAARVVVALHDIAFRDELLTRLAIADDGVEPLRRLLEAVARRAQPPMDAPVCTCVGWAAYAAGNGLVAGEALDRALRSDPDYAMARLARQALLAQVPPEEIRRFAAGAGVEEPPRRRNASRRRS